MRCVIAFPRRFRRHAAAGIALLSVFLVAAGGAGAAAPASRPPQADPPPFAALRWRNIGPAVTGTRIVDFAVVERDPRTIYAATAGSGVWKTANGGVTWAPVFEKEATVALGGIAVSQSHPDIVWVGTGEPNARNLRSAGWGDGVYKSTDAGATWTNMGLPLSQHIGRIVIHPANPDIVWVSVVGSMWGNDEAKNEARGLFRTLDGGRSWTKVLSAGRQAGIVEVAMDPRDPDVLYAAAWQRERRDFSFMGTGPYGGIFRTVDGGDSWRKLGPGLPAGEVGRIGITICRGRPDVVYAVIEGPEGGVFRSEDAGSTWERRAAQPTTSMYYGQIRCDPNDADRVHVLQTSIHLSTDGGRTFTTYMPGRGVHVDHHALWIDPSDSEHLVLGNDGGIYISRDRGESWAHMSHLPTTQFYTVAVDMRAPFYHVYGGTQDNNSLGGPVATRNSDGIVNDDWYMTVGGDGFVVAIDPVDPSVVYTESQYGGIVRFDTRTGERKSIQPRDPPPGQAWRWNWTAPILISPHDPHTVYFGAQVLFRSADRGDTWRVTSPDLTRGIAIEPRYRISDYGTIRTIAESPLRAGLLGVGTDDGLVQISRDGGRTWTRIERLPGVPERAQVTRLILSAHDERTVYAALSAHEEDDFRPFVVMSPDLGATWTSLSGNLPARGQVRSLAEHPRTPGLLFAGTETGIFTSRADGRWVSLKNNLPTVAVHDIAVHPRENDLVIGTHGRGFWILDDVAALEEYRLDAPPADAALFRTRPALQLNRFNRGRSSLGQMFFAAPNPPDGALLSYFLNPRAAAAPVTLEIVDGEGRVVRRLEVPQGLAGAGLQRVVWDLSYDAAFTPPPGAAGQPVRGPWVLPGEYQARLTAGGVTRTQPVRVRADLDGRSAFVARLPGLAREPARRSARHGRQRAGRRNGRARGSGGARVGARGPGRAACARRSPDRGCAGAAGRVARGLSRWRNGRCPAGGADRAAAGPAVRRRSGSDQPAHCGAARSRRPRSGRAAGADSRARPVGRRRNHGAGTRPRGGRAPLECARAHRRAGARAPAGGRNPLKSPRPGPVESRLLHRSAWTSRAKSSRRAAAQRACTSRTRVSSAIRRTFRSRIRPPAMTAIRPVAASTRPASSGMPSNAVAAPPDVSTRSAPVSSRSSSAWSRSRVASNARWNVNGSGRA